jgi:predicted dehydrogenase
MEKVNIGIIGGGLMGREAASAFGRWFALTDIPVKAELIAVCDLNEKILEWYKQIPTVKQLTTSYKSLLDNKEIDVVYVALPHNLHRDVYLEVIRSGKDLFGEKPFGINTAAAIAIKNEAEKEGRFVRCSSEFPFLPGAQRIINEVRSGSLGKIIDIKAGFLHSSDMDSLKPINWKRQNAFCGEIGVMGDLGMHVLHIPLRLGWKPELVFAQLQKIITQRPDGKGGMAICDTWNNATLNTLVIINGEPIPMTFEMKRMCPGEMNTWYIEIMGTEGAVKYSTKDIKAFWQCRFQKEQVWQRTDLGFSGMPFPVITGSIFEPGFPDCFMQMFAAYIAERAGVLNNRFGCVTPQEVTDSHRIFDAALRSFKSAAAQKISYH